MNAALRAATRTKCTTVAAMPIGTIPKTTKLPQNRRFAVPSSVCTAAAKTCQSRWPSRAATESSSTPKMKAIDASSPNGWRRATLRICTRRARHPFSTRAVRNDLDAADHDEEDAVGQEEPPSCCVHRLTTGTSRRAQSRDKSTGETGRAHRNAAQISDLCRYDRQAQRGSDTPQARSIPRRQPTPSC